MIQPHHILLQPMTHGAPIKWYEQGARARMTMDLFPDFTFSHLEWDSSVWPCGYEIFYITADSGVLCHHCANKELERTIDPDDQQFFVVGQDVNYEDGDVFCDHCNRQIVPAYREEKNDG